MTSFSALPLSEALLKNIESLEYHEMTPVQQESIPHILNGKDLIAQAKTGSGKTAAFGIGLLHNLRFDRYRVQGLVLCPTRELAEQVMGEIRRLARFRQNIKLVKITGGIPMATQELSLAHEVHIVVGTPGRIGKLLERGTLKLDEVKMIVLDEADRMLNMGFIDQIERILQYAPSQRQTLCFSATFPDEIKKFCSTFLKNAAAVMVESRHDNEIISQHFYSVLPAKKADAVYGLLCCYRPDSTLIFCNTKEGCRLLETELRRLGLHCLALHGDLEQKDRTEVLIRFSNGSSRILVATDVAARGLDIDTLGAVINFDLPFETETYIHRIGRTGRAGKDGLAFSLVTSAEQFRMDAINELMNERFQIQSIPTFETSSARSLLPAMATLSINGGRKNKISAGDILGALTGQDGIKGTDVGRIDRLDNLTFVAVKRHIAQQALHVLQTRPIKGRKFKALLNE